MELLTRTYNNKVSFVIHEKNLDSLESTIKNFKNDCLAQTKEHTFTFKNELVAKHVANNLKSVNFLVPL